MRISIAERAKGTSDPAAPFLQSDFWGDFKEAFGWRALRLSVEAETLAPFPLLVLIRRLPARLCFAYVPHGPAAEAPGGPSSEARAAFLAELSRALKPALPRSCLFVRYDPIWYEVEETAKPEAEGERRPEATRCARDIARPLVGPPLRRASADVQPPDTVLVDLRPDEKDILAAMKPKWRYNIRLAEKKGVVVEESGIEGIPMFYELYRTTSERDKIALHPEEYYRRLFAIAADYGLAAGAKPDARLWIARHEGQALAAIITLFLGEKATYLYGASSDEKRNLMPTYALQWAAMRAAKAAGCLEYDLFGISPTDDPDHPMGGLYRFKTGFGGTIAHRAGSWDYAQRPLAYSAFRALESARAWYFKDFRKRGRKGGGAGEAAGNGGASG
jgi:Uncharacterized protein involved in methicillin resistance